MAALTDQHVSLQIRILFHIKLGHLVVSVSHITVKSSIKFELGFFWPRIETSAICKRYHPSPLLLESTLSCKSTSVNHYSHNCPITGSNKIHPPPNWILYLCLSGPRQEKDYTGLNWRNYINMYISSFISLIQILQVRTQGNISYE